MARLQLQLGSRHNNTAAEAQQQQQQQQRRRVVGVHLRASDSIWSRPAPPPAVTSLSKLGRILDCAMDYDLLRPRPHERFPKPYLEPRILVSGNNVVGRSQRRRLARLAFLVC